MLDVLKYNVDNMGVFFILFCRTISNVHMKRNVKWMFQTEDFANGVDYVNALR